MRATANDNYHVSSGRRGRRKKEEVIDLTDIGGNHNSMPVTRELETNPVTGSVTIRSVTDPESRRDAFADTPIHSIEEDKGQGYQEPAMPPDPDHNYEEKLEAEGAFVINSTTYFPASKQTVTRKSKTSAEIAEEKGYTLQR